MTRNQTSTEQYIVQWELRNQQRKLMWKLGRVILELCVGARMCTKYHGIVELDVCFQDKRIVANRSTLRRKNQHRTISVQSPRQQRDGSFALWLRMELARPRFPAWQGSTTNKWKLYAVLFTSNHALSCSLNCDSCYMQPVFSGTIARERHSLYGQLLGMTFFGYFQILQL